MGTANMKVLLLFGLVAVALADITRFEGEKVFRLKPVRDEHVTLIKELAKSIEVDFWRPDAAELVIIDIDVDIHVPAKYLDMVHTILQQNDMEHEFLIEDLQDAIDSQADNKPSPRAHSYTKYNTWNTVQSWIASISSSNPSLISKQVIGNTYEGRPMTVLKLGKKSSSTKPAIFMDCGIHARVDLSCFLPVVCQGGSVHLWQRFSDDQPSQSDGRLCSLSDTPLSQISHSLRYPTLSDIPLSQIPHSLRYPTLSDIPLSQISPSLRYPTLSDIPLSLSLSLSL